MKPLSAKASAAFDRFWAAYPYRRENPKAPARVMFARLLESGEDAEALVAAASPYAAVCAADKIKSTFIPHARKWLNQRYFEDYQTDPDAPASAPEGPSPEHPLASLFADVGAGYWASYLAPLTIDLTVQPARIITATGFAMDRLRRDHGRRIEAELGPIIWEVKS